MTAIGPVEAEMRARAREVRQKFFARPDNDNAPVDRTERPFGEALRGMPRQCVFKKHAPPKLVAPVGKPAQKLIRFTGNSGDAEPTRLLRIPYTKARKVNLIMRAVAYKHSVSIIDMKSYRRPHKFVAARFEFFDRLYRKTDLTMSQIGKTCGGRDHTSVCHALAKFREQPEQYAPGVPQQRWTVGFEADE